MKMRFVLLCLLFALVLNICACSNTQAPTATNQTNDGTTLPIESKSEETAPVETIATEPTQMESATTSPMTESDSAEPIENFEFKQLDNGNYVITKYLQNKAAHIVLPEEYNGRKIVKIENNAFMAVEAESITISKYITDIASAAFQSTSVSYFQVDAGNQYYCSLDGAIFDKNMTTLVRFPTTGSEIRYVLPEGITTINFGAFSNCQKLIKVALPQSLRRIGNMAFSWCYNLSGIELPGGLESIGNGAFHCMEKMTELRIPASVKSIGESITSGCDLLVRITVDENNADYRSVDGVLFNKSGMVLFDFPRGLEGTYAVPKGVVEIAVESFEGCKLTAVSLPSSLQKIGRSAFANSNLEKITYNGTKAQWSGVELKSGVFSSCTAKNISCSDGEVPVA